MRFEYAPGATPIDLDEAKGLIPGHLTLQRELTSTRNQTFSRQPNGYSRDAAATHWMSASFMSCTGACSIRLGNGRESLVARIRI